MFTKFSSLIKLDPSRYRFQISMTEIAWLSSFQWYHIQGCAIYETVLNNILKRQLYLTYVLCKLTWIRWNGFKDFYRTLDSSFPFMFPKSALRFFFDLRFPTTLTSLKSRSSTKCIYAFFSTSFAIFVWWYIANDANPCVEFAQLPTLVKTGTCDWLSVNPRGNTGSRRRSKITIGPIWGITSLTFIISCLYIYICPL